MISHDSLIQDRLFWFFGDSLMYPRLVSHSFCDEGDLERLILLLLPGAMNAGVYHHA